MGIKSWIIKIAFKKIVKALAQGVIALTVAVNAKNFGVTIDEAQLMVGLYAALEVGRNYLKHNVNGFAWL